MKKSCSTCAHSNEYGTDDEICIFCGDTFPYYKADSKKIVTMDLEREYLKHITKE